MVLGNEPKNEAVYFFISHAAENHASEFAVTILQVYPDEYNQAETQQLELVSRANDDTMILDKLPATFFNRIRIEDPRNSIR